MVSQTATITLLVKQDSSWRWAQNPSVTAEMTEKHTALMTAVEGDKFAQEVFCQELATLKKKATDSSAFNVQLRAFYKKCSSLVAHAKVQCGILLSQHQIVIDACANSAKA